ncbi:DUF992 domain-containing protein [Anderseniella sp. Alg231-50]|uniref:DUF992 domain-containing protein n=1 Tax=Anderseniella sp. Alg231-50 TaxID=1922226 RepID=UPI00307B2245
MTRLKQTSLLLAALVLSGTALTLPATAQGAKPAGTIKCTLTVSVELAVGARRPVPCVFQPTAANKPAVPLEVTIDNYGAPVKLMTQVDLSWTVSGSGKAPAKQLAGTYTGNPVMAKKTDPANALSAGGEFELLPMTSDNPDMFNLASGIAAATVRLK